MTEGHPSSIPFLGGPFLGHYQPRNIYIDEQVDAPSYRSPHPIGISGELGNVLVICQLLALGDPAFCLEVDHDRFTAVRGVKIDLPPELRRGKRALGTALP